MRMKNKNLTLENLSENHWTILKDLTKTKCQVYENWKDKNQGLLYHFYDGEQKGIITQEPWRFNKITTQKPKRR